MLYPTLSFGSLPFRRCWCSAVRQVLGFHILHSFLFSALLFSSAYDDSFRNSFSIPNRFLPLGLFPIIRPSITSLQRRCLSPSVLLLPYSGMWGSHIQAKTRSSTTQSASTGGPRVGGVVDSWG